MSEITDLIRRAVAMVPEIVKDWSLDEGWSDQKLIAWCDPGDLEVAGFPIEDFTIAIAKAMMTERDKG